MNVVAIVQARMGSTRLPGKVMRPLCGQPMIGVVLRRLSRSSRVNRIVVATSAAPGNAPLAAYVRELGFTVFEGSEHDVLDRYHQASAHAHADVVVRITADCPLIDPTVVDEVIAHFFEAGADYASNVAPPTYPDGLDTEVFTSAALAVAHARADLPAQREHVTPYLRESPEFRVANHALPDDYSAHRWTVDTSEDLAVVENVFRHFSPRLDFSWREVLALQATRSELFAGNRHALRNAGSR